MSRIQYSMSDVFWVTGVVGCIVATVVTETAEIAWIGLSCLLLFFWNRPVLLRFWTLAALGIGTGLAVFGTRDGRIYHVHGDALIAWGAAMVVGSLGAFILFDVRKP
jgi:hypothetical protein